MERLIISISKAWSALVVGVACYLNDAINIPASDMTPDSQFARLEFPLLGDAQGGSVDTLGRWKELIAVKDFQGVLIFGEWPSWINRGVYLSRS
jgi:hypothetical protein